MCLFNHALYPYLLVSVIVYGAMAIGLAYLARVLSGPVTQVCLSKVGISLYCIHTLYNNTLLLPTESRLNKKLKQSKHVLID